MCTWIVTVEVNEAIMSKSCLVREQRETSERITGTFLYEPLTELLYSKRFVGRGLALAAGSKDI